MRRISRTVIFNRLGAEPKSGKLRATQARGLLSASAAILTVAAAPAAFATNFSCQTAGGSWTTAGNWTACNGTFPDNGGGNTYDATITSGNSTLTSAVTVDNVTVNGDWSIAAPGSTITLNNALTNSGGTFIDASGGQGGSSLNIGTNLTNSNLFDIGVTNLSASTNVTVAGTLANTGGTINLQGNATSGTTDQATLNIQGAMPTTVAGNINVSGDALLQVTNGITAIGSGAQLSLGGAQSRVSIGSGTTNSALAGLASNAGNFFLQGNSGFGAGGATVTTTTGFTNTGTVGIDEFGGQGGSTFNIGGALTNSGTSNIGVTNLSASTNVTATGLANSGTITTVGSSTTNVANLTVNGAAGNSGTTNIEGFSNLTVNGAGNAYAQTAGTTNVFTNGTLTAPNVNVTGGTLRGDGTVIGNLNVNSAGTVEGVNPNNGNPDALTVNGSYNQTGGALAALLQGTGAGQIGQVHLT